MPPNPKATLARAPATLKAFLSKSAHRPGGDGGVSLPRLGGAMCRALAVGSAPKDLRSILVGCPFASPRAPRSKFTWKAQDLWEQIVFDPRVSSLT